MHTVPIPIRERIQGNTGSTQFCTFSTISMRSGFAVIKGRLHRNNKVNGAGTFNSITENAKLATA
jgi:hypothetical protein